MRNIELCPVDRARWREQTSETIFVIHHAPTVLVHADEDEADAGLGPGIVAIEAVTNRPLSIELELEDQRHCHEMECYLQGSIPGTVTETTPLDRLNHNG